jgi:hypothetical protein
MEHLLLKEGSGIKDTIVLSMFCMGVKLSFHLKRRTQIGVLDNRVLRRIFETRRDEVAGGWRRMYILGPLNL